MTVSSLFVGWLSDPLQPDPPFIYVDQNINAVISPEQEIVGTVSAQSVTGTVSVGPTVSGLISPQAIVTGTVDEESIAGSVQCE